MMVSMVQKRPAVALALVVLMGASALLLLANPTPAAAGGGRSFSGAYSDTPWVPVSSASTGSSASAPNFIHGDYIVVVVGFSGTGQTVKAVSDSASPATSFTKTSSSDVNQDTEVWCGQYTAASGSDAITVTSTATATYSFTYYLLGGLASCSKDTGATGSGTSAAMSVASFTPNTGDACVAIGDENTGATSSFTVADPFLTDHSNGGAPSTSAFGVHAYAVTMLRGSWTSSEGSTTATITPNSTSSPSWDEVVACYPTSSAGNEIYQEGERGGARSSGNPVSAGIDNVLKGDYIVGLFASAGTSVTVTGMSTVAGELLTLNKAASADTSNDVEVWYAQATSSSESGTLDLSASLSSACVDCWILGMNIGSIQSTTPEVFTSSGSGGSSASLSAVTPGIDDLCIAFVSATVSNSGATLSTPSNQPLQYTYTSEQGSNDIVGVSARANWPSGVSTTASFSVSVGTFTSWTELMVCFPGTVIVPLTCSMDNGAPQATVSLGESGGNALAPTSVSCDGASHNIVVDPSVTMTATEPSDAANTRDRFSGVSTTTTDSACAGASTGVCPAWTFTNYEQLQNAYQVTPLAQTTWDAGLTAPSVVGAQAGSPGSTGCSITLTGGGGAASCSAWFDYNRAVVVGASTIGGAPSNTQWLRAGGCSFTQTSGGFTDNCDYYKQLSNTYQASTNGQGPPTWNVGLSAAVTGTVSGAAATICAVSPSSGTTTTASCTGYSDYDTPVSIASTMSGAGPDVRWMVSGTSTWTDATGGNTHTGAYYEQLQNTYQVTANAQPTFDTGMSWVVTGTSLGVGSSTICTISSTSASTDSCVGFADYDLAVTIPQAASSPPANSRWYSSSACSFTQTSGGNTDGCNSYKQWIDGFEYSVNDASSPATPTLSCDQFGAVATLGLTTSYQPFYCDNLATATATSPIAGAAGERWSDDGRAFTIQTPGGQDVTFAYYHQYSVTYAYSVLDGGSPTVTNVVVYSQFGSSLNLTPSLGGVAAWTDAGSTSTYADPIAGAAGERWNTGTASFPASASVTVSPVYTHQYSITVNGGDGIAYSTPSETGDNYWNAGDSLTVSSDGVWARAGGAGLRVASWNVDGGSNTNAASAGTVVTSSITMDAPHTVNFNDVAQYQVTLDSGATSALNSITPPTLAGDNYWYDSGTVVTVTLDGVYGRAAGTGERLADYSVNGGGVTVIATTGTVNVLSSLPLSSAQDITTTVVTQYQLTLDATSTAALASVTAPTVAGDNYWYDSGTVVTLTLNGVWARTLTSGDRMVSYSVDGGPPTTVATTGTVTPVSSLPFSSPVAVTASSATQHPLIVTGGSSIAYSVPPPIPGDTGWYDAGTSLTVSSDGVYDRAAGTGQRVSTWNIDGGANTVVSTLGTVTTSPLMMNGRQYVNFGAVTQYEVMLDATSTSALSSCTAPTIAGDGMWYDSGTAVSCSLDGVWGRAGASGERLTGYSVDGGAPVPVSTTLVVPVLTVASVGAPQTVTSTSVVQYMLTLSASPATSGTVSYGTAPSIAGDTGWYDSGTSVLFSVSPNPGHTFGHWVGTGACSYSGSLATVTLTLNCPASESASFGGYVVQPIVVEGVSTPGLTPVFTVNGCNPAPDSVTGDGSTNLVDMTPSCSFTISISNVGGTRYGFSVSGSFSTTSQVQTSCAGGTCGSIALTFYEQVDEQLSFQVTGGSGYSAPGLTCTQLGVTGSCGSLSQSPGSYWLDYGSSWSATDPLVGSTGSARWESQAASGTVTAPTETTVMYALQYLVSVAAQPQAGGTTSPAAGSSQWVDSGSSVAIGATAASGYTFSSWSSSSPASLVLGNATSASTNVTAGGPGTVTAKFALTLYTVTFTQSGLPTDTEWGVTVDGQTATSHGTSLSFTLPSGSFGWNASSLVMGPPGVRYLGVATQGTLSVSGATSQSVPYSTQYLLTVETSSNATGIILTPASGWYDQGQQVSLNASSSSSSLTFTSWSGTGPGSYTGTVADPQVTMDAPLTEVAAFTQTGTLVFTESGLPAGETWSVVLNGVTQTTSADSLVFSGLPVGTVASWVVQSPLGSPQSGSTMVNGSQTLDVTITFTSSSTTVTSTATSTTLSTVTGSSSTSSTTTTSTATQTSTSSTGGTSQSPDQLPLYFFGALVALLLVALAVVYRRRGLRKRVPNP
jgi:hypothetical protein